MRPVVQRLLESLPHGYCNGLGAIVLTRTDIARGRKRRRSRANRNGVPLGTYHPRWNGQPAWIELMVDQIVTQLHTKFAWMGLFREREVARVLYHEIGHHLDATNRSVGRTGEHGAIAWEPRLYRHHLQRRYGYLRPYLRVLTPLLVVATKFVKMMAARERRRRALRAGGG